MPTITPNDIQGAYSQAGLGSPSQGNINSFLQYANNGSVPLTQFDIGQILQGTPQYQTQMMNNFGGQLQNILGQGDQRILGIAANNIAGQFSQQGRNIGSSGYLNAYMQAAQNLALGRQQQLASFYAPQMGNIMGNAAGQANQAQQFGMGQQASTVGWNRSQTQFFEGQNAQQQALRQGGIMGLQQGLTNAGISLGTQALGQAISGGYGNPFGGGGGGGASSGTGLMGNGIGMPSAGGGWGGGYSSPYANSFRGLTAFG